MKWLLITLGVLAVLIAVVVIWGALLPRDHIASRRARFAKAPAEVWAVITDISAATAWRKDLKKVEVISPTTWRENGEMTLERVEQSAPARMVTRIHPGLPFGGTWTYDLQPDGSGTVLTVTERGEVYNPLFRFMSKFVFGHTATLDTYLSELGAHFGEQTKTEAG